MFNQEILDDIFLRYQSLQRYVGWTAADAQRVQAAGKVVRPAFRALIEDFYSAIKSEPQTAVLITGGDEQIERLKQTLLQWLDELFSGVYDKAYVARRYRVGRRHVEIGLRQIYADAALARLRGGLLETLQQRWPGDINTMPATARSLNRLIDLELALIEDSYTTERLVQQRQEVRKQSEATFRNLVEAARCVIVILRADLTLAYFSPFAEQLTGYSVQEVLGQKYLPLFLDEKIRPSVGDAIAGVISGVTPAVAYEHPIQCRNHSLRDILWKAQRLDDYEGAPAILAVGHDITDLKRAQEKLLQSERLAAIGQTVTGLAHESRNAFQRSQACLEMLAVELEGRESELQLVHRIQRALDHLHHLYEEVRDYASPIKLDRQPCNLSHVWRDAWSHLEVLRREKSVDFLEDMGKLDLTAEVDWFQMGQVFRNLLENALCACPERGIIAIKCRETQHQGRAYLEVTVRDNGPGFPPSVKEHAFDAFFTTKAKGTGLGMAIAKRIVEAHGGRIEIADSVPGAEIAITLPRS